jgi:hypothetical protein
MPELLTFTEHPDGIHEIKFHEATRQVVDEYLPLLESILKKQIAGQEPVAHLLLDLSESGAPPFTYITQQGRKLLHEHLYDRDSIHLKTAFLAKDSTKTVLSLAETFVSMLPIDATFKVFDWTKRNEAEEWLLTDG